MKKEAINLLESGQGNMGGFEMRKLKEKYN